MRNLKRALSLAVASVMLLGMMVVGTGASYSDVTSKNNQEAIEVLQKVGVMVGDDKGNFNPDQLVTRNEMAVIMANLLKLTVNDFGAVSTPFTDVPSWAAPYVAACYADGIVAGVSKTTYGGSSSVTAVQAGLMIMKALGYFQYQEDFEDDWQLATVKQASKIDLYDGIDAGRTEALTRNEVAQLALNALQADVVDFTGTVGTDIKTTDGTTIKVGYKSEYTALTTTYNYNSAAPGSHDYVARQLAEELFKNDLKQEDTTDNFGRPANKWTYKTTEVGTYAEAPIATYTNKVTKGTMYSLIGKSTIDGLTPQASKLLTTDTDTLVVVVDGDYQTVTDKTIFSNGSSASIASTTANLTGNGAQTSVYKDDDGNVTIAIVNTYLVQATGDYNKTRESLTVDAISDIMLNSNTLYADDFAVANFEDEDYILVTAYISSGKYVVDSVAAAQVLTGKVTSYTESDSVAIDNTTYKYAFKVDADSKATAYSVGDSAAVVLDSNGYVIYVDDATVDSGKYVYINEIGNATGVGGKYVADAYFTDGTNSVINVKKVGTATTGINFTAGAAGKAGWYTYTINSSNEYELKVANVSVNTFTQSSGHDYALEKGVVAFGKTVGGLIANSKTIFVVKNLDGDVDTYTGIANAPSIKVKSLQSQDIYYVLNDNNAYARFVYIDASKSAVVDSIDDSQSSDSFYFVVHKGKTSIDGDDNRYVNWKVMKDGIVEDMKTVENPSNIAEGALVKNVRTNSDGYVTGATVVSNTNDWGTATAMPTTSNAVYYKDGVLTLDGKAYVVSDKADIYLVVDQSAALLMDDENNDYEVSAKTADGLYKALRGYSFAAASKYQVKIDSDTKELTGLYVYATGTVAEDMTVTYKATPASANTGITLATVAVTEASNTISAIALTVKAAPVNGDKVVITATVANGASASGSIVLEYTAGAWVAATGTITVVGTEGTVANHVATAITPTATVAP